MFLGCSSDDDGGGTTTNPPAASGNQFAYVGNYFGDNVQAFTTDGNGDLTMVGNPITVGSHPHNVNVDRAGRFVYISNHDSNFVSGYTINSSTGSLIPINPAPGSPVTDSTDPTNSNPHWSVFDTTGQFLYVIAGSSTGAEYTQDVYGQRYYWGADTDRDHRSTRPMFERT